MSRGQICGVLLRGFWCRHSGKSVVFNYLRFCEVVHHTDRSKWGQMIVPCVIINLQSKSEHCGNGECRQPLKRWILRNISCIYALNSFNFNSEHIKKTMSKKACRSLKRTFHVWLPRTESEACSGNKLIRSRTADEWCIAFWVMHKLRLKTNLVICCVWNCHFHQRSDLGAWKRGIWSGNMKEGYLRWYDVNAFHCHAYLALATKHDAWMSQDIFCKEAE